MAQNHSEKKKDRKLFLLIDDDPTYLAIMKRAAELEEIDLHCCQSLVELGSVGALAKYQVVLLDYNLGEMTGVEIAEYLGKLIDEVPTVLVSASDCYDQSHNWPKAIKRFVKKSEGYSTALKAAVAIEKQASQEPKG